MCLWLMFQTGVLVSFRSDVRPIFWRYRELRVILSRNNFYLRDYEKFSGENSFNKEILDNLAVVSYCNQKAFFVHRRISSSGHSRLHTTRGSNTTFSLVKKYSHSIWPKCKAVVTHDLGRRSEHTDVCLWPKSCLLVKYIIFDSTTQANNAAVDRIMGNKCNSVCIIIMSPLLQLPSESCGFSKRQLNKL